MLKKNRRCWAHAKVTPQMWMVLMLKITAAVVLLGAGVMVVYSSIGDLCASIGMDMQRKETRMNALDSDYARMEIEWSNKIRPEALEEVLLRLNIAMQEPTAVQQARMDSSGRLEEGQPALAYHRKHFKKDGQVVRREER